MGDHLFLWVYKADYGNWLPLTSNDHKKIAGPNRGGGGKGGKSGKFYRYTKTPPAPPPPVKKHDWSIRFVDDNK